MTFYRKDVGRNGEDVAVDFLQKEGYSIVERNFRAKLGELDIIAEKDSKLHFIEVKARNSLIKGYPHEAVNAFKLRHLKRTVEFYLLQNKIKAYKLSLDVISILFAPDGTVQWIKHFKNVTI